MNSLSGSQWSRAAQNSSSSLLATGEIAPDPLLSPDGRIPGRMPDVRHAPFPCPSLCAADARDLVTEALEPRSLELSVRWPLAASGKKAAQLRTDRLLFVNCLRTPAGRGTGCCAVARPNHLLSLLGDKAYAHRRRREAHGAKKAGSLVQPGSRHRGSCTCSGPSACRNGSFASSRTQSRCRRLMPVSFSRA